MVPKAHIFRILLAFYLACLLLLCFADFGEGPQLELNLFGIATDKIVHFLMYVPFPLLCYGSWGYKCETPLDAAGFAVCSFMAGILLGAGIELGQVLLTDYRSAETGDLVADGLGLILGSLSSLVIALRKQFARN